MRAAPEKRNLRLVANNETPEQVEHAAQVGETVLEEISAEQLEAEAAAMAADVGFVDDDDDVVAEEEIDFGLDKIVVPEVDFGKAPPGFASRAENETEGQVDSRLRPRRHRGRHAGQRSGGRRRRRHGNRFRGRHARGHGPRGSWRGRHAADRRGALMSENYIRNVVEAALLAAGRPLQLAELAELFEEHSRPEQPDLARGARGA